MADCGDDITNCPICSEFYAEVGDHVPRILPCFHTLCEKCIRALLQHRDKLDCPECREKYSAHSGVKTFPQNKYVITYIKRMKEMTADKAKKAKVNERCHVHKEEARLYCRNPKCKMAICQTCLLDHHKSHDFVDINQERKSQVDFLVGKLDSLRKDLQLYKEKTTHSEMVAEYNNAISLEKLTTKKVLIMAAVDRRFDKLIKDACDQMTKTNKTVDEISAIDKDLAMLDTIKEGCSKNTTLKQIARQLNTFDTLAKRVRPLIWQRKTYKHFEYRESEVVAEGVEKLCGRLMEVDTLAGDPYPKHAHPVDRRRDKNTYGVCLEMSLPIIHAVKVLSHGMIIALVQNHNGHTVLIQWKLQEDRVDQHKVLQQWPSEGPTAVAEVKLNGVQCLAVSYVNENKINFHDVKMFNKVVHSLSVSPNEQLGNMCTESATTLWYEDRSKNPRQIKCLDCTRLPIKHGHPKYISQESVHDICYVQGQNGYLVTSHFSRGLFAYDKICKLKWSIKGRLAGTKTDIIPQSITTDGRGHLFVSDISNGCIHKFSVDGKYLGSILNDIGEAKICWCPKTSSLVVIHRKGHDWYIKRLQDT